MPWFAGGSSGAGGASFGYVLGMLLAATVVGDLARRGGDRSVLRTAGTMVLGSAIIYAVGVPYLALSTGMSASAAIAAGLVPVPARRRAEGGAGDGRAARRLEARRPPRLTEAHAPHALS